MYIINMCGVRKRRHKTSNTATSKMVKQQEHPIRYIPVTGSTEGACPRCRDKGTVYSFCIRCCEDVGIEIGDCRKCRVMGPMGHLCNRCGEREFTYVDDGRTTCPGCGMEGPRGTYCFGCNDQCYLSEWSE
jgi:hypothetical protein